jgi:nucleoside-diphosphate-sugar epimerase
MNILITGGTGFLGSHLARSLSGHHNVGIAAIDSQGDYLSPVEIKKFNFAQCDIRGKVSLEKVLSTDIDLVIHCAAMINIKNDGRCPDNLVDINLKATIDLMEAMVNRGIKNLVFCSSMTVYGIDNVIPVKEEGLLRPVHFYGLSKKWSQEAVEMYANNGLINALILRYPGLYGYPKAGGHIYNCAKKIIKNEKLVVDTKGLKFWESINVEDAAEITKNILSRWDWKKNIETFNCSYGEEADFVATAFKIKDMVGSDSEIKINEPRDYVKFYLDNSKLKNLLGNFNYSFERGLGSFLTKHKGWITK